MQPDPFSPIIAIQQGAIADYRVGFYRLLKEHYQEGFRLYAGDTDFPLSIKTVPEIRNEVRFLNNRFFAGRRLLWQSGRFRERLLADILILNFNLRNLSNYPTLILHWILRKPTLLWGHVTGQSSLGVRFAFLQLFFAKAFICYTHEHQQLFRKLHPKLKIPTFVAPNSCMQRSDCYHQECSLEEIRDIVYVGRFVEYKKVHLLINGFFQAREQKRIPLHTRLILVGSGPLEESLRQLVSQSVHASSVVFTGHLSDIQTLREIYSTAFCSVSPGALGLSAIQSYAFGVPLLVADQEPHGPEVGICHDLQYGRFFNSDSMDSLAKNLSELWDNRQTILQKREHIIAYIKEHHTLEGMVEGFAKAISCCLKRKKTCI